MEVPFKTRHVAASSSPSPLATVVVTTSQCLERWGELRRYLLQSSLREQSVSDVSDDPLSSSTFFDPLLRTGARELKGMKWRRIRRHGVTDEVFTLVLGNGSSHLLAWVQVPHWRGQRKKKSASLGRVKGLLLGSLRLPIFFLFDPVFCLFPQLRSLVPGYSIFFRFLFSVGVLLSVPSSRNLSCTVIFASVPCGGGVHIGCKVGVLWPPFKRTHLICGTHPSRGRGCPFA